MTDKNSSTDNMDAPTPAGQRRVLILVPGELSDHMAGPVIRAWSIARVLSQHFTVTAAVPNPPSNASDGVRLVPADRRTLRREMVEHDVLISACVPPYLLAAKGIRPTLIVSDQYDPADLEASSLSPSLATRRRVSSQIAVKDLQLRHADVILYANERQRERMQGRLDQLGRTDSPLLVELPFGLGEQAPVASQRLLRDRFTQIEANDTVILWWGLVWRWLDADTAVRAFARLAGRRPDIKLVFAPARTMRRASAATEAQNSTDEVRDTAQRLGVLDRTVLFWDDWVPFNLRHELLSEADFGLSLHGVTDEAHFSARVRYLDYLWAGLPCILASGDLTGERFEAEGFAKLVPPGDVEALERTVEALADNAGELEQARAAGVRLAAQYRWDNLVKPLARAIESRHPASGRLGPRVSFEIGGYYARRTADAAVFAVDRHRPRSGVRAS